MVVLEAAVVEVQQQGTLKEASGNVERILTILVVIQSLNEMLKLAVTGMVRSCLHPSNVMRILSLWDKALLWRQDQNTLPEGL